MNLTARLLVVFGVSLGGAAAGGQSGQAPMTWSQVAASYGRIHDYTATYEKEERAIDDGEPQTIRLFFRKPLDVRLEWLDENGNVGQTAVYRKGFNDDKVVVRRRGLLGSVVGRLKLDPRGGLAQQDSRHPITEVGIGYIIDHVVRETGSGAATSRFVGEEPLDGRPASHFQLDGKGPLAGLEAARRADIWIDREWQLPVKVEIRDSAGTLLERHRFKDLRLNSGLTGATFTL